MNTFTYRAASSGQEAVSLLQSATGRVLPIGGGTDFVQVVKDDIDTPDGVVDLSHAADLNYIRINGATLEIGATTPLTAVAEAADVAHGAPILQQAALAVGTPQIRNRGTIAGNLCQRPRCWYFRNPVFPCYRKGGSQCFAVLGRNRPHAILGGAACFMVHPSDMAPALMALRGSVQIAGKGATRTVSLDDFFIGPLVDITRENILQPGEMVQSIRVPLTGGLKGVYEKARTRNAWDFATVSVAAAAVPSQGRLHDVRLVLGGVAPVPYRCTAAEQLGAGAAGIGSGDLSRVADAALTGAKPLQENGYKVGVAKRMITDALTTLLG